MTSHRVARTISFDAPGMPFVYLVCLTSRTRRRDPPASRTVALVLVGTSLRILESSVNHVVAHSKHILVTFRLLLTSQVAAGFYHTIVLTGGSNEELSDLDAGESTAMFSPYKILNHPALVVPQDPSNVEGTVEVASAKKVGGGHPREAVSPEIGHPVCIDQRAGGVPEEPANLGLGNVCYSQSEPNLKPGVGVGICHSDGQVNGRKAAVVILAHMDRLVDEFGFAKGRVPIIGHAETAEAHDIDSMPGKEEGERKPARDTYVVDISPDTFELLASILASISEEEHFQGLGEDATFQAYMLLAALRLLKANLVQLLQSHISERIVESMLLKPPPADPDDASEFQFDRGLQHNPVLYALLFDPPTKEQDGSSGCDQNNTGTDGHKGTRSGDRMTQARFGGMCDEASLSAEVERYRVVLYALQRRLLLLVHADSSCVEGMDNVEPVQREAAAVLVLGLEVFFPGQTEQFRLLSKLICTAAAIDQEDRRDMLVRASSDCVEHPACGPRAARYHILAPLLQRLCKDALTSKLIPYGADEYKEGVVCTTVEVSEPSLRGYRAPAASPHLLEIQVKKCPSKNCFRFLCQRGDSMMVNV